MPTIHEEVQDLEPMKVLNKRTRGGSSTKSSGAIPPQPKVQKKKKKKKKKKNIRKLKVSDYVIQEDAEVEAATDLVTRMEINKKRAVAEALEIAKEIDVSAEVLMKESTIEDAQKVVELAEGIQELVVVGDLLDIAEGAQRENVACSEAGTSRADASEATRGNISSHNICDNVVEIKSTSTSTSSYTIDDIPLSKVYEMLNKSLAPSPSTKHQKKPVNEEFVPMYPFVLKSIGEMAQMRIDVCQRLHANHPLQPPFIQPLQTIPADAEVESEQAVPESDIPESSSQPQPTTQTSDPSVLEELINHYQGELPSFKANSEKASEIASDEVILGSPQQQQPELRSYSPNQIQPESQILNQSLTDADTSVLEEQTLVESPIIVAIPAFVSEAAIDHQPISVAPPSLEVTLNPAETSTENDFMITTKSNAENVQPTQIGTTLDPSLPFVLEFVHDLPFVAPSQPISETSITDIPSSSTQPISTNVSPPPTLFLDSTILKEVCENIFKDLNRLVKTRNNLVHENDYVDEWTGLKERVDYVMCELQKLSLEAHNQTMNSLQDCFKNVISSMEEVEVNRNQEKSKLYISDTPIYLDASSIITTSVHL